MLPLGSFTSVFDDVRDHVTLCLDKVSSCLKVAQPIPFVAKACWKNTCDFTLDVILLWMETVT